VVILTEGELEIEFSGKRVRLSVGKVLSPRPSATRSRTVEKRLIAGASAIVRIEI
jgi:hypothetical protein